MMLIDKNDETTYTEIENGFTKDDINERGWNDVHVIVNGNTCKFYINGKLASEFTENLPEHLRLKKGWITLQVHDPGMVVQFKDVRVKVLD